MKQPFHIRWIGAGIACVSLLSLNSIAGDDEPAGAGVDIADAGIPADEKSLGLLSMSAEEDAGVAAGAPVKRAQLVELEVTALITPGNQLPLSVSKHFQRPIATRATVPVAAELKSTEPEVLESLKANDRVAWIELARPPDVDELWALRPFNQDARSLHLVPEFMATYPGFDGSGIVAAVFDEGAIRASHSEFLTRSASHLTSRVSIRTQRPPSTHASHVAGTIAARGVDSRARGMAPSVRLWSFDFHEALNQLPLIARDVQISNHSYGPSSGWERRNGAWFWWGDPSLSETEDFKFGKYTSTEAQLDAVLAAYPHLSSFVAAGNDRSDAPSFQPVVHYSLGRDSTTGKLIWVRSALVRAPDASEGAQRGFDTVTGLCVAKNSICIGAIEDHGGAPMPIRTTDFSNWGPTDDGRIKPDLVANGQSLLSVSAEDDRAYTEISGTSMACPTAAGIGALLLQQFQARRGRSASSAELKAVLIHTAVDGGAPGPDPMFGWGAIHSLQAGHVIARTGQHLVELSEVSAGTPLRRTLRSDGGPIRVTVVWTDPASEPNGAGVDDSTPALRNDLDLMLVSPDGAVHFPFSLDRSDPSGMAARNGPNRVDNVEVVVAPIMDGRWTLEVNPTRLSVGTTQRFALVTSGLMPFDD
ncbi:S8 family serine peptidase [Pyxidicoccus trucidator]|uniref:S8 family serine peptidase n=1 Tax=Pyxidicoccus trucidator TaxID=2709662 RepID=UPI0013D9C432|nr:S8 family serine peptidase [Pyxidicoccus trucidator]